MTKKLCQKNYVKKIMSKNIVEFYIEFMTLSKNIMSKNNVKK